MESKHLIQEYSALAGLISQMLSAAQQNNWDSVSEIEVSYLAKVNQIKHLEKSVVLDKTLKSQKLALIKRILADDETIRLLIHPWMSQLNILMQPQQSRAMQTKLNNTYRM
jgi:flagellar protein FliT